MSILRPLLTIGCILSMILAACSPAAPVVTSAPPSPPLSPQPTLPQATQTPTSEPPQVDVPVLQFLNDRSKLMVISSVTGQQIDSFTPIEFHNFYNYTLAPDEHTLALVADAKLFLIDLPSWKYRTFDIDLHGWLSAVVYSPDGNLLTIASGLPGGDLRVIDVKSGEVKASTQAGVAIRNVKFTIDGKALMVYGPHIVAEVSVGPPEAALFTVPNLSVLWSVELKGVRDGTFPKKPGPTDIYQPGAAWHYEPGIAFSPNSDTLYLVHGDEDKLTTVDFAGQKVHTVDVQPKRSWLDRIMAWTAGVAYAKGMDGTTKQAFISPDGKFLFVGGNMEKVTLSSGTSDFTITDSPIGLQVIAVEDGSLVANIDVEAAPTGLSSDGRYLLLAGWKNNDRNGPPETDIYDTTAMSLVKHMEDVYLTPTRRMDGKPILVSVEYTGTNGDNVCNMTTVDPDTWTMIHRWQAGCLGWLTLP